MVVWRPALDHRGKGQLHTGLLLKMPDSFQVFCLPTIAGCKRRNAVLSWLDHSSDQKKSCSQCWMDLKMRYFGSDVSSSLCLLSCPRHHLISFTSQVAAYQHWRLLCHRAAKRPQLERAELCVKGKEGSRYCQSSYKHHNYMIYFCDGKHAQFTPVKMPKVVTIVSISSIKI